MIPAPIVASLAEQPAYYALYALYADYQINTRFNLEREYFARLRDSVRFIQPLTGLVQPDMKSWALRLFTERQALARFSPEVASAAWRLVRQLVDEIGEPRGWAGAGRQRRHRAASFRRAGRSTEQHRTAVHPSDTPAGQRTGAPFPRSPVDYRRVV
jgi:hypothetical protein